MANESGAVVINNFYCTYSNCSSVVLFTLNCKARKTTIGNISPLPIL